MVNEAERKIAFKQAIDLEGGRRRRQEVTISIRKNKKEESLLKRRGVTKTGEDLNAAEAAVNSNNNSTEAPNTNNNTDIGMRKITIEDIPRLVEVILKPDDMELLTFAVRGVRKLLSTERNAPVDEIIASGILPRLVEFLGFAQWPMLMFESAWAITNIASTDRTCEVVNHGAVVPLIRCLQHESPDVREQAAWCLGNIAGDRHEYRDLLLQNGVLTPLLANIEQPANTSLLGNVVWSVSNLCRGRPVPAMELVERCIPPLVQVIRQQGVTMEALVDAVWSLAYLSDGSDDRIQKVMDSGVTPQLVALLEDKNSPALIPVVRCLGNFVTGTHSQTQAVIDAGILKHLRSLLTSTRKALRKEACWLVSNIAAGTQEQIDSLLNQGHVMRSIVDNALNADWEIRKESIWAISNVCTTGTDLHVRGMMACDGLKALTNVIEPAKTDAKLLLGVLDAIFFVMKVGERTSTDYGEMLEELDGVQIIENLQEHPNEEVYEKAVSIVETFFGGEEVDEDENLAPETNNGTFAFGISSPPPAKQLFPPQKAGEKFMFGSPHPKAFGSANTVNMTL